MLNEKNPLNAQALSDDDLDGVVGGVVEYNGVTYNTYADVPPEIMEEIIARKKNVMSNISSSRKTCMRCHQVFATRALTWVDGWGEICSDCIFQVKPNASIEAHT